MRGREGFVKIGHGGQKPNADVRIRHSFGRHKARNISTLTVFMPFFMFEPYTFSSVLRFRTMGWG